MQALAVNKQLLPDVHRGSLVTDALYKQWHEVEFIRLRLVWRPGW
jgi:hypothetical protein